MEIKDIIITPEQRAALSGILGFDTDSTFPYVPKAFRALNPDGSYVFPKELWTVYILKGKNGVEASKLENDAGYLSYDNDQKKPTLHLESGKERLLTLRSGIKGWRNFWQQDGTEIKFNPNFIGTDGLLREKHLEAFPVLLQIELQDAINERSILTPEELAGLGF